MTIVLDSSVTLAWIYTDEVTPAIADVFERVIAGHAVVPAIWRFEVANGLLVGVRRQRLSAIERDDTLVDLAKLDVRTDPDSGPLVWTETVRVAERYKLTIYDACYLELAFRHALPLATLDQELRQAAQALGVMVLGE